MKRNRAGFTLVELLVVIALIAFMATLAVLFFPNAATSAREANAAQQLQAWLNTAKQRALRNQRPSGLRLYIKQAADQFFINDSQFTNVVTECQYIEQPDDFGNPGFLVASVPLNLAPVNPPYKSVFDVVQFGPATVGGPAVDLTNGYGTLPYYDYTAAGANNLPKTPPGLGAALIEFGPKVGKFYGYAYSPNQKYWTVQPCPFILTTNPHRNYYPYIPNPQGYGGDYIEFYGNGMMHQVIAVLTTNMIQIAPPLSRPITTPISHFRIVRAPRVMGSETLQLPDFTFIDLNTNGTYNNPLPNLPSAVGGVTLGEEEAIVGASAANAGAEVGVVAGGFTGASFIDILFSPSGQVITPGVSTANLNFWVRCPNEQANLAQSGAPNYGEYMGSPTIVSVFVRTGFVGAFKVNTPAVLPPAGVDPYAFVR